MLSQKGLRPFFLILNFIFFFIFCFFCETIPQIFGDFFLKINIMIDSLQQLISRTAVQLGLVETEVYNHEPYDNDEYVCQFEQNGNNKFYTITHDRLNIIQDFLKLSPKTLSSIDYVRQFKFNLYNRSYRYIHNRQNITINNHDQSIVLSFCGKRQPSLSIHISSAGLCVSLGSIQTPINKINNLKQIDNFINQSIHNFLIPNLLSDAGFQRNSPHSPEVLTFISKTVKELFNEGNIDPRFNYMPLSELVHAVCRDLDLNFNDVMTGVDTYTQINNIYIPSNLTNMLSSVAQKVVNIDGIKSKIDQLINLFMFIDNLNNKTIRYSLTLRELDKGDFLNNSKSINRAYYILNMGSFVIQIGHDIPKVISNDSYIDSNNDVNFFAFFIRNDDDFKEYITNDFDYMYNLILTEIRDKINATIGNQSDYITQKDLDVYKMAMI